MNLRNLGASGLRVSAVGLGCNNFGGRIGIDGTRLVIDRAIERGITLFDTADSYGNRGGSESLMGEVLGARRNAIVLATKFGWPMDDAGIAKGGSRRYVMSAVEASLRRLKTDWIDLYQFHLTDPLTPIEETLRALEDLVRQGKVRYVGWSNTTGWRLVDAAWTAQIAGVSAFVSVQAEYNVLDRRIEAELIPAARAKGVGLLPFFPLAGGLLSGKYSRHGPMPEGARLTITPKLAERYLTGANWDAIEILREFCKARRRTLLDLAFAWLLAWPVVGSVIAGATRPEQIDANVAAADWTLTAADIAELDKIIPPPPAS